MGNLLRNEEGGSLWVVCGTFFREFPSTLQDKGCHSLNADESEGEGARIDIRPTQWGANGFTEE